MSRRDQILLSVAVAVALIAGAWFVLISPERQESHRIDQKIDSVQQRLDQATTQLNQELAARTALRRDAEALLSVTRAVPTQVAMPAVLRGLSRTAAQLGVTMASLTASPPSSSSSTSAVPGVESEDLQLTFTGGFLNLQRFLARVQNFVRVSRQNVAATGRLMSVSGVSLSPASANGAGVQAQVHATIYVLQPVASGATGATPASGTTPAPAASSGSSPTPAATEVAR